MPIIRFHQALVFFSHIPKTGGTSIEKYLQQAGARLGFSDFLWGRIPRAARWSRSSPQHVTSDVLVRLFPPDLFDAYFAVCRDPVERFRSAFWFHQNLTRRIPPDTSINDFVATLETSSALAPGNYDNHFQPQVRFLYPRVPYQLFRIEDGLDRVKTYIDTRFLGGPTDIPMPHEDFRKGRPRTEKQAISPESVAMIMKVYAADYDFFRYPRDRTTA